MKKIILMCLITLSTFAQKVITDNNLVINHGDMVLYLTRDTCTMVSKHTLSYTNFLKIGALKRNEQWFQDTYYGKYLKKYYAHTGYDLGHLTPAHITSYDKTINKNSYSMFNVSPQMHNFNTQSWRLLEDKVETIIKQSKSDAIIITGVIYSPNKKTLAKSRIPIPIYYFKVLYVGKYAYSWIGDNETGLIKSTTINDLNDLIKTNKQELIIQ
jgi:DNA/RNA endonuclease G (NUC1)